MSSPTKANSPRDVKRVAMACTNCRQKKLKCRKPDEIQRDCTRCIESGVPCEYVPVNPSTMTPNAPHHDSQLYIQPLDQGSQSLPPPESIRPVYYTTQPHNMPRNPNMNIDPSLMGPHGIVPNPPATGGYPLGQSSLYPAGPPLNPSARVPNAIFPPQSHGHQGPYLPSSGPWGDQSRQYGDLQETYPLGRAPYQTQYGTGVVWSNPPTNDYQYSGYTRPSGDQQDYPYGQAGEDFSER